MLISSAHAQAAAAPSGGGYEQIFIMIAMFAVLYFIMIRPQQKKAKEHRSLLDSLKKGDTVITAAGIHGKITAINDNVITLEIAPGVNIKINKAYIASLQKQE